MIRSLTPAERAIDLDVLLACLATALNLEHLTPLNAVPLTFECAARTPVSLARLRELHLFQLWVFEGLLGAAKFFEHRPAPFFSATQQSMVPWTSTSHRALTPFVPIMEFYAEASHLTPGKPARNNLVFYSHRAYKTLFIIRFHRGSLDVLCSAVGSTGGKQ
jgi:hypothetical protein